MIRLVCVYLGIISAGGISSGVMNQTVKPLARNKDSLLEQLYCDYLVVDLHYGMKRFLIKLPYFHESGRHKTQEERVPESVYLGPYNAISDSLMGMSTFFKNVYPCFEWYIGTEEKRDHST